MKLDITKIANAILYMIENKVSNLNDKKLAVLLFLIDFSHLKNYDEKIFGEVYIKDNRNPEPKTLGNIFGVMINNEDLEEIKSLMEIETDSFLRVKINQKIFSSSEGEMIINIDKNNNCNKVILKDVLLFGDITAEKIN